MSPCSGHDPTPKALLYTRVSTLHQTENTSLAAQFAACQKQALTSLMRRYMRTRVAHIGARVSSVMSCTNHVSARQLTRYGTSWTVSISRPDLHIFESRSGSIFRFRSRANRATHDLTGASAACSCGTNRGTVLIGRNSCWIARISAVLV